VKIAFVTEYADIGGGEKNLLNLSVELSKYENVSVFCPPGKLSSALASCGVQVEKLQLRPSRRWLGFVPLSFSSSVKDQFREFDLIHAYSPNALPYAFHAGRPLVWTTHGQWEKPYGLRARVISRFVCRVICVSDDVYRRATFHPSMKTRIPLGTPIPEAAASRTFDPRNPVFSCIARFQKVKGQDLLLDALNRCNFGEDVYPTVYFVGGVNENRSSDYRYREEVVRRAAQFLDPRLRIHFEGQRDWPEEYVARSDVVVIPSRYESFSMVAVESLAAGRPVIAPNIGGPAEIINSPSIGLLFTPGDPVDLSVALETAVQQYHQFDPNACRARGAFFSIAVQADAHLKLYNEVLGEVCGV